MNNAELERRIAALEAKLRHLVRVGEVVAVDEAAGTARVGFADAGGLVTHPCRVLVDKSLLDQRQWMPDLGEQVLCIFLAGGLEQGFVVRALYSSADPAPGKPSSMSYVRFADGTELEYDREAHRLSASVRGDVDLVADGDLSAQVQGAASLAAVGAITASSQASMVLEAAAGITLRGPSIAMQGMGGACAASIAANLSLVGDLVQEGSQTITGDVSASGTIMDGAGNSNHHTHEA